MIVHGKVKNGVVVLDEAGRLAEGMEVIVTPADPPGEAIRTRRVWTPEERKQFFQELDRITAERNEGAG